MSNDWQPGDLALCVDDSIGTCSVKCLEAGKVYTVDGLDFDPAFADMGLHLCGVDRPWSDRWQQHIGWSELRFRKVTPPEADEFDREVIDLMNQRERVA